jgi:hypothetical protein
VTVAGWLRAAAIAIAVFGAIDPAWTLVRPLEQPIAIRVIDSSSLDVPAVGATRRAQALAAAERLRSQLGEHAAVRVVTPGAGSVCPEAGVCLVIGDGPLERNLTAGAAVAGAIDVSAPVAPNVAIVAVDTPVRPSLHGSAMLRVRLRADEWRGQSDVEVRDAGVLVGAATHVVADGAATDVEVPWVPLAAGPRRLQVSLQARAAERTTLDNVVDVGVEVHADAWPIVIEEPEMTWTGTFIRRALEDDARFAVHSRVQTAPGLAVSRGGQRVLTPESLDQARVAIVTAPERLSSGDVERLERFVRIRGGSVVLPLDRRPTGPAARLIPAIVEERNEAEARPVGELRASEFLIFGSGPGVSVLEAAESRPVIVSRAMGRGRVIASGALDAWRSRRADRFRRFWTSLIADAAPAAPAALNVRLTPVVVSPHQEVRLAVSQHSIDPISGELTASAVLRCGDTRESVRLWPGAQPGHFTGVVTAPASGSCEVEASIDGVARRRASATFLVSSDLRRLTASRATLASAAAAHGAPLYRAGQEGELAARARELLPRGQAPRDTHPMRSPWWLVAFVGCLAAEWSLRRRRGLR